MYLCVFLTLKIETRNKAVCAKYKRLKGIRTRPHTRVIWRGKTCEKNSSEIGHSSMEALTGKLMLIDVLFGLFSHDY